MIKLYFLEILAKVSFLIDKTASEMTDTRFSTAAWCFQCNLPDRHALNAAWPHPTMN
jgi:hypothetical protein